jgi:hypothetical protein
VFDIQAASYKLGLAVYEDEARLAKKKKRAEGQKKEPWKFQPDEISLAKKTHVGFTMVFCACLFHLSLFFFNKKKSKNKSKKPNSKQRI